MNKYSKEPRHRSSNKRWFFIGLVFVAILIAAGVGGYTWLTLYGGGAVSDNEVSIANDQSSAQQQADELFGLTLSDGQNLGESSDRLSRLVDEAESVEDKSVYLSTLVSLHQYVDDYELALYYASKLEGLVQSDISAATVAGAYLDMGNFIEAASYYQLAADRSEPIDDPHQDAPYNHYINRKKEAEAQL